MITKLSCPSCGSLLVYSMDELFCTNPYCPSDVAHQGVALRTSCVPNKSDVPSQRAWQALVDAVEAERKGLTS